MWSYLYILRLICAPQGSFDNDGGGSDTSGSSLFSELNFCGADESARAQTTRGSDGSHGSPDSDAGQPLDMGDYENRIRPSSEFWRRVNGMTMAEKIIVYRNWKYNVGPESGI